MLGWLVSRESRHALSRLTSRVPALRKSKDAASSLCDASDFSGNLFLPRKRTGGSRSHEAIIPVRGNMFVDF